MSQNIRSQPKPIVVVFGATGQQGGAAVRALREQGRFSVRAVTRDASRADRVPFADEVTEADLTRPDSLDAALEGAFGVYMVTNFWERNAGPGGVDEVAQGRAAIDAAKHAGVQHFVWSTLPDADRISEGQFDVSHFTGKAKVDAFVATAGFPHHTFVEAPFYFQNLSGTMAPQPQDDGVARWVLPMDPKARVIHMGDVNEFGAMVADCFARPELTGDGARLSFAGDLVSWNDVVETLNGQGHRFGFARVPAETFDGFFPGAREVRKMFEYFEAHTYFGPDADVKIALAAQVSTHPASSLEAWARHHLPAQR